MPKGLTDAIEKAADRAVTEEGIRLDEKLLGDPDDKPVERVKGGGLGHAWHPGSLWPGTVGKGREGSMGHV